MARTGIIVAIIMIVIALFVFGAIAPSAITNASNTTLLVDVPASTIAIYGLIGLIACVSIVLLFLKAGTGGR